MAKIMLVEDDNNLREIYEARLAAEGYEIVAAQDGEAALALAARSRPNLIITDVMMPKISGFEMLDILRNTESLRDVKVIMLTALGQVEDSARASALGADRYLVKSQVTLEDIVKATHEVLGDNVEPAAAAVAETQTEVEQTTDNTDSDTSSSSSQPAWQSNSDIPGDVQPVQDQVAPEIQPAVQEELPQAAHIPVASDTSSYNPDVVSQEAETPEIAVAETADEQTIDTSNIPEAVTVDDPVETGDSPSPIVPAATTIVDTNPAQSGSADDTTATAPIDPLVNTATDVPVDQNISQTSIPTVDPTDNSADSSVDDNVTVATNQPQSAPTDEAVPVSIEVPAAIDENASSTADEEAQIRSQIDNFLDHESDNVPASSGLPDDVSSGDSTVEPEPIEPLVTPLPEESASEIAKDDAAPDMGQLSIHAEPIDGSTDAPAVASNDQPTVEPEAASEPASYELPVVPPAEPWATGDKAVSDAVNTMMAPAPLFSQYGAADTSGPAPQTEPTEQYTPNQPAADLQDQPAVAAPPAEPQVIAPQPQINDYDSQANRKKVIAPLGTTTQPDIHQLLALEEAKAAAGQAAAIYPGNYSGNGTAQQYSQPGQQPPSQQTTPQSTQAWDPGHPSLPTNYQGIDPNSISL